MCVVISVLVVMLPGCAKLPSLSPATPATIKFLYAGDDSSYYESRIETFNKAHPNITVEITPWRGFAQGGLEQYDVFAISEYQFPFMQEQGALRDLNALIEQDENFDLNDFYPSTVNAFSIEGRRWAIPVGINPLMMCYNKQLFDRVNAPYPDIGWTWGDFQDRAISVSSPAAGIYGYAYYITGSMSYLEPMTFIYQHGGQLFDNLQAPTQMILNAPLTVEALDWYGRLIHEYHVSPAPGERMTPYPITGIEEGKYAMWMCWYAEEREAHWGVAPLPRDANGSTMGSAMGLVIAKETLNPEASWKWAAFLSEQLSPNMLPARRSLAESTAYSNLVGSDNAAAGRAALNELLQLNLNLQWQQGMTWNNAINAFNSALTTIRGGEDAQTALDAAQKKSGF